MAVIMLVNLPMSTSRHDSGTYAVVYNDCLWYDVYVLFRIHCQSI